MGVGFLRFEEGNFIEHYCEQNKGLSVMPQSGEVRKPLSPAIISSCVMSGPSRFVKAIPERSRFIEYYACMHADLDVFFPEFRGSKSALGIFAESADSPDAEIKAETFAEKLRKEFSGKEIVAFASFIPEIMPPGKLSNQSAKALRFLVMTADKLNGLNKAKRPFVVEFVGGSRTRGLTCRHRTIGDSRYPEYHIGVLPSAKLLKSIKKLIRRLKPVATEALNRGNILLALQLEPGPFFLVNDADPVDLFCGQLQADSSQPWKRIIGINLDIGHWAFLAKHHPPGSRQLTTSWLRQTRHVLNRIVHAHISDQSIGHLCDLHLEALHQKSEFAPWMELLEKRMAEEPDLDNGVLPFSGFVGIEHEACKSAKQVGYSFDKLEEWLSFQPDDL